MPDRLPVFLGAPAVSVLIAVTSTGCASPPRTPETAAMRNEIVCKPDPGWNDPATPRRIHGNAWYVGTCGISAVLVTSPQGHALIDSGTEQGAPQVEANIRALGFELEDVRYILASHEHSDHAGGMAQLQRASGATVVARAPAAETLERGKSDRRDPQFMTLDPFPPVANVRRIADGETIALGALRITAHATPGHTPGSTSWSWDACDASGDCRRMAYVDSLTAISDDAYRFSDDAQQPALAAFRKTIATVAELPCDILITPHPGASNLWARLGATAPLTDANACRSYAATASKNLDARLAKEAASGETSPAR